MEYKFWRGLLLSLGVAFSAGAGHATPQDDLIAALPKSNVSLADGVHQIMSEGQPLSAKFEFDDDAKLSLSIDIVAKGPLGRVMPDSSSPLPRKSETAVPSQWCW